jgi:hypothetical protein
MPRATINPVEIKRTGTTPAPVAPDVANGNQFQNDGVTLLRVKNTGGATCTVTVKVAQKVDGLDVADLSGTVPASGEKEFGVYPTAIYNQPDGNVYFNCSTATGVTVEVHRVTR